jgi:hypothetical protein
VDTLLRTLAANTELAEAALESLVAELAISERDCDCFKALETAIITQRDLVPESLLDELRPILGHHLSSTA